MVKLMLIISKSILTVKAVRLLQQTVEKVRYMLTMPTSTLESAKLAAEVHR
jgi:hypothetical protein